MKRDDILEQMKRIQVEGMCSQVCGCRLWMTLSDRQDVWVGDEASAVVQDGDDDVLRLDEVWGVGAEE